MIKWLHQLFNPHCQHCADERREQREFLREQNICSSCETLANQNDRLVRENERLLSLLLEKPNKTQETIADVGELKPIVTSRFIPTRVRREMLENEARHTTRLANNAPKPDINKDEELTALEQELKDVRTQRESETKSTAVNQ